MLSRARIVPVVAVGSSWLVVECSQLLAALRSDWWVGCALGLFVAVYGLVRRSMGAALSMWPDESGARLQSARNRAASIRPGDSVPFPPPGNKWPEEEWL